MKQVLVCTCSIKHVTNCSHFPDYKERTFLKFSSKILLYVIYSKLRHTWSLIYYLPLISLSSLLSFRFFQYIIICLARLCEDEMRWLLRDAWDITHGQTFASFYIFLHKSLFYHSQRRRNSQGRVVALTVGRGTWNLQGTAEILTSIIISRLMCALHTILTSYLPKVFLPIYWVVFFLRSYYSYQNGDL